MSVEMKTLTIDGNTYEVVDETARNSVGDKVSKGEFSTLLTTALTDSPDITVKDGNVKIETSGATKYMSMSSAGFVVLEDSKIASIMKDSIQFVGSNNAKITGLAAPANNSDAANKEYVDTKVAAKQDKISGTAGQMIGFNASGNPVAQEIPDGSLAVICTMGNNNMFATCSHTYSEIMDAIAENKCVCLMVYYPEYDSYDSYVLSQAGIDGTIAFSATSSVGVEFAFITIDGRNGIFSASKFAKADTANTYKLIAGDSVQDPATSLLRNSKIVSADTNPSNNGEINWTYK